VKRWAILAAIVGLAGATVVVALVGWPAIVQSLARIGWRGLAVLIAYAALPFSLLGLAWSSLDPPWRPRRWLTFIAARMARDASGELLPFSQVGGLVVGARAAAIQGLAATWATATVVVDVLNELLAQLGFTIIGVVLLIGRLAGKPGEASEIGAAVAGLGVTAVSTSALVILQRRGLGIITGFLARIAPGAAAAAKETAVLIEGLHRRPGRLALAVCLHLLAWASSAFGVWLALDVAGVRISPLAVIGLEALVLAARSAMFIAPMGIGVQEASYAILGPLFGLSPDIAVALSLIKRARDLIIGAPVLLIWQIFEGRRMVIRRSGLTRGGV
jgi:putative membrane protein